MSPDESIVREFLRRLGHRVALVGLKPIDPRAPKTQVIWPAEQDDPADQACWLSGYYSSVYCNLNPLHSELLTCVPPARRSVSDAMIARRTRLLIDVDAHGMDKGEAFAQKDRIKAALGPPLIESDSGNGYGLIYPIDYPNDADARQRISILLNQLKADYPCVDTSVFGAGRLTRVIGTLNRSCINGQRIPTTLLC